MGEPLLPAFAGFLFALAVIGPAERRPSASSWILGAPDPLVGARELDPDRMCARDLRRLPGIGPARSLAIVRARFEHGLCGGPGSWTCIDGIGPETVRSARAWLEAAGAEKVESRAERANAPAGIGGQRARAR